MTLKELNPLGHELNEIQQKNAESFLKKITELEIVSGFKFQVTSGYRNQAEQNKINPAVKNSAHQSCQAVDISDPTGDLWNWCCDNLDYFLRLGLYLESRSYTPRWTHITDRPPKSGCRIFIP
jgi:hypothetical protein